MGIVMNVTFIGGRSRSSSLGCALRSSRASSWRGYFSIASRRVRRTLNAFISVTREQALAAAEAADRDLAASRGGALTGVPIAHKDIFCTRV